MPPRPPTKTRKPLKTSKSQARVPKKSVRHAKKASPKSSSKPKAKIGVPMVALDGLKNWCGPFHMAKTNVTVADWNSTIDWAFNKGYSGLEKKDATEVKHFSNCPVRSVCLNSVALWCNARSQQDGLQPCYYLKGRIFKNLNSLSPDSPLDWVMEANGYRVPTHREWVFGLFGPNLVKILNKLPYQVDPKKEKPEYYFKEVHRTPANCHGILGMIGNVREWVWQYFIYPQRSEIFSHVLGTSYRLSPSSGDIQPGKTLNAGSHDTDIGFRIARNKGAYKKYVTKFENQK